MRFDEILTAVERLPPEDQQNLLDIVHRRLQAQRRAALVKEVEEARQEFAVGKGEVRTPEEIMREILS